MREKFKIYVRPTGQVKVRRKNKQHKPVNPSAVAFVLRHISGRTYDEQKREAERLLGVVEHTAADRKAIDQILKSRCQN